MSDINESLAWLAANAEQKRAKLEIEVEALRAEKKLLEQERDMALYERDRYKQRLNIARGEGGF